MKNLIVGALGGLGLSSLSLTNSQEVDSSVNCADSRFAEACEGVLSEQGFPFSYIKDNADSIESGQSFIANQFNLAPAVANFIFWGIVAIVLFKFLGWTFDKLSTLAFAGVVLVLVASYLGLVQVF